MRYMPSVVKHIPLSEILNGERDLTWWYTAIISAITKTMSQNKNNFKRTGDVAYWLSAPSSILRT